MCFFFSSFFRFLLLFFLSFFIEFMIFFLFLFSCLSFYSVKFICFYTYVIRGNDLDLVKIYFVPRIFSSHKNIFIFHIHFPVFLILPFNAPARSLALEMLLAVA